MIGRTYSGYIENQAQTAALTLIGLAAAADLVLLVERVEISQSAQDTAEQFRSTCQRVTTDGTATDSSAAMNPKNPTDTAFSSTFNTNYTAEPTYTANTILWSWGWNTLTGMRWTPANDDEIIPLSPSGILGIDVTAPDSSMSFNYGVTVREIGG